MKRLFLAAAAVLCGIFCPAQEPSSRVIAPDGTFKYATKDGQDLYLDWYKPAPGSTKDVNGIPKPAILFAFGGGFMSGSRYTSSYGNWFKTLTDNGYTVISIDYRLGLKGAKNPGVNPAFIKKMDAAIAMAVEDLFSATNYVIEHAVQLGVDPRRIVVSGSSAGAMTVLQGEWEICNAHSCASVLPRGFNYAGVMAFSGSIFSREGPIKYKEKVPCPTLMFHGTADRIVEYNKIAFLNLCFAGSSAISESMDKYGYCHRIYRFAGNSHEISDSMQHNLDREFDFLEQVVTKGLWTSADEMLLDATFPIPDWVNGFSLDSMYH